MVVILIFLGLFFKIMHWPGGEAMLTAGMALFIISIIVALIVVLVMRRKKKRTFIPGTGWV